MFDIDDLHFEGFLNLDNLLKKVFFNITVTSDKYETIITKVNTLLKEKFLEEIEITIESEDKSIKIKNVNKNIEFTKDIKKYFNEAKLNLVILSILFAIIEIHQDEKKKRVLILDDFITSLDVSNRTFIIKYILETFSENFQIVIFTHNVYFYNLIMYLINEHYTEAEKWQYANLYETTQSNKVYINPSKKKKLQLSDLKEELENQNPELDNISNKMRQKFEILLYELSKIMMVGGVEESKNILNSIIQQKKAYLYKDGNSIKGIFELIEEIDKIVSSNGTILNIKTALNKYELNNLNIIKTTLKDLKLYQKVHLHPLSHGQIAQSNFNITEAKTTLILLEKLEQNIFNLSHKNVDGA